MPDFAGSGQRPGDRGCGVKAGKHGGQVLYIVQCGCAYLLPMEFYGVPVRFERRFLWFIPGGSRNANWKSYATALRLPKS